MTNVTVVLTTRASGARYTQRAGEVGTWAAACEAAYEAMQDALKRLDLDGTTVEITKLEPQEANRWATFAHPPRGPVLRVDLIDDLPRSESMPSIRVGIERPTPDPPH